MDSRRLVIVAEEPVRSELSAALSQLAYTIDGVASSVAEVSDSRERSPVELFVVHCPAGDEHASLQALDLLRHRMGLPVLGLFDASDSPALKAQARRRPARVLLKPFSLRELHATVELAFASHVAGLSVEALEERFFAVAIDLLCALDYDGHFKRLSPSWERTLGYTAAELTARPFIEFVHPDDRERTLEENRRVRAGAPALAFENRYVCKDGSFRWFRWNAAPDVRLRTIYSVARDVTAAKQAEEERERLVLELQAALAEVKTLQGILPICSYCRRIRDDQDYWHSVEGYFSRHTSTRFSHGVCPGCMTEQIEPQLRELENEPRS